ncbi:ABC transporter permease [Aliiroseovarius sp.]|uniref:ABC transporter permease n=1 Tax=Aliiroseovarius sp. TaxID=1872442 RepID=UPI003BABEF15
MDFLTILQITDSGMRLATPLLFACLAGLFSERAGIFDIGLEGKILVSAFFSAGVAAAFGSVWLGLLAGLASSLSFSLMHGVASITFRGNQLISGVALNYFASGITILIGSAWFALGGRTPSLKDDQRFGPVELPMSWTRENAEAAGMKLNEAIAQANPVQQIYSELLSGHTILVYVAIAMVPLSWWVLNRTRFGLRLRAVGENPGAVDTSGVSVIKLRFAAMVIAGLLCGMAGTYMATGLGAGFVKEMSGGRGYIALAALIFANWRPWHALGATFLFGLLQAIANRYQSLELGGVTIPVQLMEALPYILTVVILAGFIGKPTPPKAGGQPYVKER